MNYKDQTVEDFEHLKLMRNRAGEYLAKREYNLSFEALLDIKRDIKARKLHPSMFDNILEEVMAIGLGLANGDYMVLIEFGGFISKNQHKLKDN